MTDNPQTGDATPGKVTPYQRWTLRFAGYVRWAPIFALAGAIVVAHRTAHPYTLTVLIVFALALPGVLAFLAARKRPSPIDAPRSALFDRVPQVLFLAALVFDAAALLWWRWEPACPRGNALFQASKTLLPAALYGTTGALYVFVWVARYVLSSRKKPRPPHRTASFERIARLTWIQLAILVSLLVAGARVPAAFEHDFEASVQSAGTHAATIQDRFHAKNGRYAATLDALREFDPSLKPEPGVSFHFAPVTGDGYSFTVSHPKACEPFVYGN